MTNLNIWFSIFIPLIGVLIAAKFYNQHFVWWEYFVGILTSLIVTTAFLAIIVANLEDDIEYHGSVITSAQYTEYYETYVRKTCSRQYACGTYTTGSGKNRTTHTRYCTEYYDCSYCDDYPEHWDLKDNLGNTYSTSEKHYNYLKQLWNNESFINLNRSINYSHGCGKDGDRYITNWDRNIYHSENITSTYTYTNPTINANSTFKYRDWTKEEVKAKGLYDYPTLNNRDQSNIIGYPTTDSIKKLYSYLNGYFGSIHHGRYYLLFYDNKSQDIALSQESYWKNGNQNEVVICIGHNKGKLLWVKVFGWGNQYSKIKLREDIMSLNTIDMTNIYNICVLNIKDYKVNDLQKEFNFLKPELPGWSFITIYGLNIIITILSLIFGIKNEI
jgi:hypothetical protein